MEAPARRPSLTRRTNMYTTELRDRAALLARLGVDRAAAKARLRASVDWDFELHAAPAFVSKIDGIVDEVYGRAGTTGQAPTL
jgi:hypothetical protein